MKAVILAAGMGSRLYPLTQNKPKALLEINGRTLLDRVVGQLADEGVNDFVVVTGYCAPVVNKELRNLAAKRPALKIRDVENPSYSTTGTSYSLWLSMPYWDDDLLIIEGDLVVDKRIVAKLMKTRSEAFLISDFKGGLGPEEMKVRLRNGVISKISKKFEAEEGDGEYIGMGRFRGSALKEFGSELDALISGGGRTEFYEAAIQTLVQRIEVEAPSTDGQHWTEIDFASDYEKARGIFWEETRHAPVRKELFGRTSHSPSLQSLFEDFDALYIHDFCYLANPFFPPESLTRELRMKIEHLMRAYPSLNREVSEKVSRFTGLDPDMVVVGNGATELIDHMTRIWVKDLAIPVPTFSEYLETAEKHGKKIRHVTGDPASHFRVDVERLASEALSKGANAAVLINPDNPSGQYLPIGDVRRLLEMLSDLDLVMVDESFSDFASVDTPPTVANLCEQHKNLVVVKSLGKIYGLPGLRLGYAVTADRARAAELRRQLPVWNSNSMAEFFLDRLPQYAKDYEISRVKVIACTQALREALGRIKGINAFPSATNFVLARIESGMSAAALRDELLARHNIYIRDCSNKIGIGPDFARIACRTEEENMLVALKIDEVLNGGSQASVPGPAEAKPSRKNRR